MDLCPAGHRFFGVVLLLRFLDVHLPLLLSTSCSGVMVIEGYLRWRILGSRGFALGLSSHALQRGQLHWQCPGLALGGQVPLF